MGRPKVHWTQVRPEFIDIVSKIVNGPVELGPMTRGRAINMRQQFYTWRLRVQQAQAESEEEYLRWKAITSLTDRQLRQIIVTLDPPHGSKMVTLHFAIEDYQIRQGGLRPGLRPEEPGPEPDPELRPSAGRPELQPQDEYSKQVIDVMIRKLNRGGGGEG